MDTDRPWMTALEMQFAALECDRRFLATGKLVPATGLRETQTSVKFLPLATPFAWSGEALSAVLMASKSIPAETTVTEHTLPEGTSVCWWYFGDSPIQFNRTKPWAGAPGTDGSIHALLLINGASIRRENGGYERWLFFVGYTPMAPGLAAVVDGGMAWDRPLDVAKSESGNLDEPERGSFRLDEDQQDLFRFILAACAWLRQRILATSSGPIERHLRRRIAREHGLEFPEVKVIQLRRTESEARGDSCAASVEWSCRWLVGGHWRNQYHGESKDRELIYILPYVKGPDDKPLKVPTHTVYRVDR